MSHITFLLLLVAAFSSTSGALELRQSIGRFSTNLFEALTESHSNVDIIISPFSVLTDLAMTWFGARQDTATELQSVLQLSGRTRQEFVSDIRSLLEPLQANSSVLHVVNRIYVQNTYRVRKTFNRQVRRAFFASAESLDFGQSQQAANTINSFVSQNTRGMITHLVDPSALSADTRMLLINAVYFKTIWKRAFQVDRTYQEPFYVDGDINGANVSLDFMHQTTNLLYADLPELNAIIVGLPYKDNAYCMHIILPNQGVGLQQLHRSLIGRDLSTLRAQMDWVNVNLSLPKFKTRFHVSLNEALQKLGLRRAFTAAADFRDLLDDGENVFISDVVHEAYIKVDEAGTEAAAATAIYMARSAFIPEDEQIVQVNRPFLYYIEDRNSNVFFYGQFSGQSH